MPKNNNIQALRGIAILLVLFAHLGFLCGNKQSYLAVKSFINASTGVDLFFIISGYLMGVTFIGKTKVITLETSLSFYKKRANRLLATCLFWSLFILAFYNVWIELKAFHTFQKVLEVALSGMTFTGNIYSMTGEHIFTYLWSVGIEMQFYIALPFLLYFSKNQRWYGVFFALILISAIPWDLKTYWMTRVNGLLIGVLLWFIVTSDGFINAKKKIANININIAFLLSVAVIMSGCLLSYKFILFGSIGYTVTSLFMAFSFLMLTLNNKNVNSLISKPLEFFGTISFSLYMCHIPIWILVKKYLVFVGVHNTYQITVIGLTSAILLSYFSYRCIEQIKIIK